MPTASSLVARLHTIESDLPNHLAAQIVALGREATPLLIPLLHGEPGETAEGTGAEEACADCGVQHEGEWARLHAVDLLTELRDPVAIDAMLAVLAGTRSDEAIHDKIVERLPDFGADALEPILGALAQTAKDTETAESLCCILSALGVRDERILQALLDFLAIHPRAGAVYLADYGDAAACTAVLAVIAAFDPRPGDSFARMELLDLLDAYASLGGELPADVQVRVDAMLRN